MLTQLVDGNWLDYTLITSVEITPASTIGSTNIPDRVVIVLGSGDHAERKVIKCASLEEAALVRDDIAREANRQITLANFARMREQKKEKE